MAFVTPAADGDTVEAKQVAAVEPFFYDSDFSELQPRSARRPFSLLAPGEIQPAHVLLTVFLECSLALETLDTVYRTLCFHVLLIT